MSNEVEKATATVKSEDFRPLPTPEQVRAHGDGGLWESNGGALYRFFDRPRNEAWWDVGGDNGAGFSRSGRPWSFGKGDPRDLGVRGADSFRPLKTIGKPRPWSEIDAITGATTPPASTPATPAIVPPPGGKFQAGDVVTLHRFSSDEKFATRNPGWNTDMAQHVGKTVSIWSPQGPCRIDAIDYSDSIEQIPLSRRRGVPSLTQGAYRAQAKIKGDVSLLPENFDLMVEYTQAEGVYHTDTLVGCRRIDDAGNLYVDIILFDGRTTMSCPIPNRLFDFWSLKALTNAAYAVYGIERQPEETDEQLRQRCRDKWIQKETTTMSAPTTSTTMPNFADMTPARRAEYRKALDAAEPPTFKSALMSGLEHAPIEGALDRAHKLLDEAVTTFWVAGSDDDKATVRRFFRDLLTSEYGKAGMAFGAGALLPYAADAAESLLPGDSAAPRYINRAAWLFTERGATITARELGGAAIDAIGPLLGTLRRLLVDLVAGMRVAEKGVAGLLTASPVRGGDLFGGGMSGVVGGDVETTQAKGSAQ